MIQFDQHMFQIGWNHQPDTIYLYENHKLPTKTHWSQPSIFVWPSKGSGPRDAADEAASREVGKNAIETAIETWRHFGNVFGYVLKPCP